tara:strand:- start:186 stop:566 length:381 start_codon:yes stop_codon:yes gene_type:complete
MTKQEERDLLALTLEGSFGASAKSQGGGGYLDARGPDGWHGGVGGQGWHESTPEWSGGKTELTDFNVGKRIGDWDVTGGYSSRPREVARPSNGGNPYFAPIDQPEQRFNLPGDNDKQIMFRLKKDF